MSNFNIDPSFEELSAELLLSVFFPDIKEWTVNYGSFFSRNYSGDLKSCDPNAKTISISRNGLYDILPEKLFFDPEELRNRESRDFSLRINEIYEEERSIQKYFQPFDSFFFNRSLNIHMNAQRMIEEEPALLLKLFFNYDLQAETNPYVRTMAPLLLNITQLRGDFDCLTQMLAEVIGCKVDYSFPSQDMIQFIVHKLDLNQKEYLAFNDQLKPLFAFVVEWFIPMQMDCVFKVKDYQHRFVLSEEKPLVLDYNTQL
ncbi:MAG: hypothetical protein IKM95_07975 [Bacteroidales bacterium]|nr:hypothetical protein [Bacteroidales bacterium]